MSDPKVAKIAFLQMVKAGLIQIVNAFDKYIELLKTV